MTTAALLVLALVLVTPARAARPDTTCPVGAVSMPTAWDTHTLFAPVCYGADVYGLFTKWVTARAFLDPVAGKTGLKLYIEVLADAQRGIDARSREADREIERARLTAAHRSGWMGTFSTVYGVMIGPYIFCMSMYILVDMVHQIRVLGASAFRVMTSYVLTIFFLLATAKVAYGP